jgi:hypothetical protein
MAVEARPGAITIRIGLRDERSQYIRVDRVVQHVCFDVAQHRLLHRREAIEVRADRSDPVEAGASDEEDPDDRENAQSSELATRRVLHRGSDRWTKRIA